MRRAGYPVPMTNTPEHERPTAGTRTAGWVGYACVLVGIVAVAVTLFAAGGGFEGWAAVGLVVGVVVVLIGAAMILVNFRHRRLRGSGGTPTHEPGLID